MALKEYNEDSLDTFESSARPRSQSMTFSLAPDSSAPVLEQNIKMQQASFKEDRKFGVDSRWSWVTAGFLSWHLSMALITPQCVAVVFYGIIHSFGVKREEAAWPIVLSATVGYLAGPIMGYLCQRFSCQVMLLSCSATAGGALVACAFVNSLPQLNFIYGVVFGVAISGIFVAANVLVSQHFEKRRTTACSLIFFFSGLNMLFAPPLAELFRSTYGISGTFLLLGGLTLNAFPAAIVLRSPGWLKRQNHSSLLKDGQMSNNVELAVTKNNASPDNLGATNAQDDSELTSQKSQPFGLIKPLPTKANTQNGQVAHVVSFASTVQKWKGLCSRAISKIPKEYLTLSFTVIALSFAVVLFGMATFLLVLLDIAADRGVAPARAVLFVNAFGVGDLVFRPLSGLVIDSKVLSLEACMFLGFLVQAIALEVFVWLRSFPAMLVCSVAVGVSNGSRISLQAPALVKDFGITILPLLMGGVSFYIGIVITARPLLVGLCRDQLGSYDVLLHIVAAVNIVFFAIWVAKYFAVRRQPTR